MLKTLFVKVLAGALAGSLLLSGFLGWKWRSTERELSSAKEVIQSLNRWRDGVMGSLRLASGNDKIRIEFASLQIQAMGQTITDQQNSLKSANDATERLADESARAKARAEDEAKARAVAIQKAEDLADRLKRQSLKAVPPDQVEAEIRRTQDLRYEAGL